LFICHIWCLGVFTTFGVPKLNDFELKFWWYIPTLGGHMSTKGHLKINYFISSRFMQIGLTCTSTSEHRRWCQLHFFGEIWLPWSLFKWMIFIYFLFMIFYLLLIYDLVFLFFVTISFFCHSTVSVLASSP